VSKSRWQRTQYGWRRRSRQFVLKVSPSAQTRFRGRWWRSRVYRRADHLLLADLQFCNTPAYARGVGLRLRRYFRDRFKYGEGPW